MSRKWNPFKKKSGKTDSHGTTLANEEMFFQPSVRPGCQWGVPNNALTTEPDETSTMKGNTSTKQNSSFGNSSFNQQSTLSSFNQSWPQSDFTLVRSSEGQFNAQRNSSQQPHPSAQRNMSPDTISGIGYGPKSLVSVASIPRTSPKVAKKLIKPGVSNASQPNFLKPTLSNQVKT